MEKYKVILHREAVDDISEHIKSGNKSLVIKISTIIEELSEHPESGTGKPERLKHKFHDYWSRRLDDE